VKIQINHFWEEYFIKKEGKSNFPTEKQILTILQLIRVQTLNVDSFGTDETQAKDTLRSSLLRESTQSETEWKVILDVINEISISVYEFLNQLLVEVRDVIFLPVDKLTTNNLIFQPDLPSLAKLPAILENWPGLIKQPSFLVIDGLDATRLEDSGKDWKDLIN